MPSQFSTTQFKLSLQIFFSIKKSLFSKNILFKIPIIIRALFLVLNNSKLLINFLFIFKKNGQFVIEDPDTQLLVNYFQ